MEKTKLFQFLKWHALKRFQFIENINYLNNIKLLLEKLKLNHLKKNKLKQV